MDLSKLSNEELMGMLNAAPSEPAPASNLSQMSDEDLMKALGQGRPAQAPEAKPQPLNGAIGAGQLGIQQGLTFGFGDEIMAGMMTPVEAIKGAITGEDDGKALLDRVGDAYERNLTRERGKIAAAREEHPIATGVGEAAGGLVTGGNLSKGGVTLLNTAKPTATNMIARGAGEGAAYGAAYGLGEGEGLDDRLNKAASGARIGAATGGILGGVAARGARKAAEAAVPDVDALQSASRGLYKEAEQVGLAFKPQSFAQGVDDIAAAAADAGIDRTIHPKATAALARLEEAKGQPLDLKQFDILRRVLNAAAKSNEPDERRVASIMIDKLDDYLDALPASEVLSGDPKAASSLIKNARQLWSRARKADVLDEINRRIEIDKSKYSASGRENAIRTEFRALAKRKDFTRMFSENEQKAIVRVAEGGPVGNALRWLGKLAPSGVVSGAPAGAALYMGEPVAAAGIAGIGMAGRAAATAATRRNATLADLVIRNGGVLPTATNVPARQKMLLELGTRGGGALFPEVPSYRDLSLSALGRKIP